MGCQATIAGNDVGDTHYSPMWRITAITWTNPAEAKFLTTSMEISQAVQAGLLGTDTARVAVNCPFMEIIRAKGALPFLYVR